MSAILLKGAPIVEKELPGLRSFFAAHSTKLVLVIVGKNPTVELYVKHKLAMAAEIKLNVEPLVLSENSTTENVMAAVQKAAARVDVDGIVVQLRMPDQINQEKVLCCIPPHMDPDALHQPAERPLVGAPVTLAIARTMQHYGIDPKDKNIVVIGNGMLVGKPTATWLRESGARVRVFTDQPGSEGDVETDLRDPAIDVIVSATGKPDLLTTAKVNPRVIIIDAGSGLKGGKISGDAEFALRNYVTAIAPVPGGIGGPGLIELFRNTVTLKWQRMADGR